MADYYTHFSCLLDVKTTENAAQTMAIYDRLFDAVDDEDFPGGPDFLMSIYPDEPGTKLWIRDDAGGNPDEVMTFVMRCTKGMGLTGLWGFEWANTCSKARLDGFGGGAHIIDLETGESLEWIETRHWLTERLAEGGTDA